VINRYAAKNSTTTSNTIPDGLIVGHNTFMGQPNTFMGQSNSFLGQPNTFFDTKVAVSRHLCVLKMPICKRIETDISKSKSKGQMTDAEVFVVDFHPQRHLEEPPSNLPPPPPPPPPSPPSPHSLILSRLLRQRHSPIQRKRLIRLLLLLLYQHHGLLLLLPLLPPTPRARGGRRCSGGLSKPGGQD